MNAYASPSPLPLRDREIYEVPSLGRLPSGLSSTPHFVLRLSVEGRSLRLEESWSKEGEHSICPF